MKATSARAYKWPANMKHALAVSERCIAIMAEDQVMPHKALELVQEEQPSLVAGGDMVVGDVILLVDSDTGAGASAQPHAADRRIFSYLNKRSCITCSTMRDAMLMAPWPMLSVTMPNASDLFLDDSCLQAYDSLCQAARR